MKWVDTFKACMPRDRHALFFFLAFTLFYLEDYNLFSNPIVLRAYAGPNVEVGSAAHMLPPLVVSLIGFLILSALYSAKRYFISQQRGLIVCSTLIACAPALWSFDLQPALDAALRYAGVAFFAFGHLCFLPSIAKNLAILGPAKSLVLFSGVIVARSLLEPTLTAMPRLALSLMIALTPFAALACFHIAQKFEPVKIDFKTSSKTVIPRILFITLAFVGVLSQLYMLLDTPGKLSHTASLIESVVVAAVIILGIATTRVNFNRLIYLLSIPLMVYGVALLALRSPLEGIPGFFLFNFGFHLMYAALWALYGYLIRYATFNYYWLSVSAALGTFSGKTACVVLFELLERGPSLSALIPFAIATILFAAMILSIAFYGQNNMKRGWGTISPQDDFLANDAIERSCGTIAELSGLTPREKNVFILLSKGKNSKSIAEKLNISNGTARTHIKHIYVKLGIHSHQELIDLVEVAENQRLGDTDR